MSEVLQMREGHILVLNIGCDIQNDRTVTIPYYHIFLKPLSESLISVLRYINYLLEQTYPNGSPERKHYYEIT